MIASRSRITSLTAFMPTALAVAALLVVGCSPSATPMAARQADGPDASAAADIETLLIMMQERLLVMHDVARWKWHQQQPITDTAREAALLTIVVQKARAAGLDADLASRFMTAQIAAGKQVQQDDMDRWQIQPPAVNEPLPDLATNLRPKIDQLNAGLIDTLARLAPHLCEQPIQRRLAISANKVWAGAGLTDAVRATALEPLVLAGTK